MGVGRRGVDVTSRVDLRCERMACHGPIGTIPGHGSWSGETGRATDRGERR
jgi:hypothetical protein